MLKGLLKINLYTIFFIFLSGFFIFAGCSHYSSLLFIYKNYSYEILESNSQTKEDIKKNCRDNGYKPDFVVITKKGEESIVDIINEADASLIYLDPLIRESPDTIARKYLNKLFFTLKRDQEKIKPVNLLTLYFDRGEILKQAGTITGRLLLNGLSTGTDKLKGKKAGMIIYPVSPEVREESSRFMNGFFTVQPGNNLFYREVNNLEDKIQIKSILDEMISNGVVIFFFRIYFLNTYGLDYVKKQGSFAIVENFDTAPGYENTVIFTIEDDFPASLPDIIQNIRIREDGSSEWGKKEIKGKIKINWGSAIESPE